MILILVFPLYFGQREMLPLKGDCMVKTVNDHMVILCQHYMGTYFDVNIRAYVGGHVIRLNNNVSCTCC